MIPRRRGRAFADAIFEGVSPSSFLLSAGLALGAPNAHAAPDPVTKKTAFLAAKSVPAPPLGRPARAGQRAERPVFARHAWTDEVVALEGTSVPTIRSMLRCHFTGRSAPIPAELIDKVRATAATFDTRKVLVISGYRSPKYNLWLRKKGREVARNSQHTRGMAIDFRPEGADIRAVYRHLRRTHEGGVGFYPVTRFVHVDLGPRRTWRGT
ncbi:MAG: DUF882 domain-containing protein [Deltaproteobacteria bacterium]|nr:MAG: DUF882 domain-containing protein [Deltaproteobacteria bacterium]